MILICGCTHSGIVSTPPSNDDATDQVGIEGFSFSVDPTTIVQGQCAVVRWAVKPDGDWPVVFNNETVEHVDQREVCPERTQEYELWADPPGPDVHEEIITLEVVQPDSGDAGYQGEGEIISFHANPERIERGECAQLAWQALAPPDLYFILNGEPVPPSGNKEVCPLEDTVYELLLVEPEERIYAHQQVSVVQPAGSAQDPTPAGSAPTQAASPASASPTATSQPGMVHNPRILDIFLARMPVGEVQVRIKEPDRVDDVDYMETGPEPEYWLRCEATIYHSDRSPSLYSGAHLIPGWGMGDVSVLAAFPQGSRADSAIDFTDSWGDVTCRIFSGSSIVQSYSERLP
jgi:hypothetical protein